MFVKFKNENSGLVSFGKMVSEGTTNSLVEVFRDPGSGIEQKTVSNFEIQRFKLPLQASVFYPSRNGLAWVHSFAEQNAAPDDNNGQLLETKFAFDVEKYLLGHCYSPYSSYVDKLSFLNSALSQRKVALGVQSILPSNVNLEDHQMEVARKFLEDPLQRYILADEVGLGKTIEAGYIIKQIFFDLDFKARVLICCPKSLKKQWKAELADRFYLGEYIDTHGLIEIIEYSDLAEGFIPQNYDLLVIDEAHKVMPRSKEQAETEAFKKIRKISNMSRRLLLLSATPALHNEFGFLSMLSFVDPLAYRLDDINDFKKKVSRRESIASIIAALTPENFDFLSMTLDRIRDENLGDELLLTLVDRLDDLTLEVDANDSEFLKTLSETRGYLSEAYKLNHRVIRNRRSNLRYITQNRGGVGAKLYKDNTGKAANFFEQFRTWTAEQITIDDEFDLAKVSEIFIGLRDRLYNLNSSWGAFDWKLSRPDYVKDQDAIRPIIEFIKSNMLFEKRCLALIRFLTRNLVAKEKVLVFVSDTKTADGIHSRLQHNGFHSIRHNPNDEGWRIFNTSSSSAVLVCDERAEEGLNIQGDRKQIFHFDLPFNANRIEQRIGRVDRYGEESPVVCHVSLCHSDYLELAWFKFLKSGLHIFENSVASLQYLIEDELNDVSFRKGLLEEGALFLDGLKRKFGGQEGKTQSALRSLDQQDSLEELTDPPENLFYGAQDLDADFEITERDLSSWLENHLELSIIRQGGQRFQVRYNDGDGAAFGTGGKKSRIPKDDYNKIAKINGTDNGLSFDRNYCLKTDQNVPSLMRYGNSFFDGLYEHTSETPLGSVSGMWRYTPKLESVNFPQVFLKNTFLVETDIDLIIDQLNDDLIVKILPNLNMIKRRCDGLFPPEILTNWITYKDDLLTNLTVKAYLEDEPDFQAEFKSSGFDIEVCGPKNGLFAKIMLEQSADWKSFCSDLLIKSEVKVRDNLLDSFYKNEKNINAKMSRRLNRYKSILDNESLDLEISINNLILQAIKNPKLTLITNLMVCMTSDFDLTNEMLSGQANI